MATQYRLLRFRTKAAIVISFTYALAVSFSFLAHYEISIWLIQLNVSPKFVGWNFGVESYSRIIHWGGVMECWQMQPNSWIPLFLWNKSLRAYGIAFPCWLIAIIVFIPTFLLWRKDRRIPEGHCRNCGYNLTGNVSGKCSECGVSI